MRVREIAEEGDERWAGGTTPWETGGMAGRLRDCLGSERAEGTANALSPGVISREQTSCRTKIVERRVREGKPPMGDGRGRGIEPRNSEWLWAQIRASMRRAGQRWSESTTVNQPASVLFLPVAPAPCLSVPTLRSVC